MDGQYGSEDARSGVFNHVALIQDESTSPNLNFLQFHGSCWNASVSINNEPHQELTCIHWMRALAISVCVNTVATGTIAHTMAMDVDRNNAGEKKSW